MRVCRFAPERVGLVRGDRVYDVTDFVASLGSFSYPLPRHDVLIANIGRLHEMQDELIAQAPSLPLDQIELLSPVANPGKLVAAPVNYQAHLDEAIAEPETFAAAHVRRIQETGLFLKATSSLVGASEGVALRFPDRRNDHEIELAVVVGKRVSEATMETALDCIAGYTIGLDMTVRGPEERSLRKSIDSYSVLGPWLVTPDEIPEPGNLGFALTVNGESRQAANTKDLVLGIRELICMASSFYTLEPGDVIFTGTPEGVGQVHPGDVMHARIDLIGSMTVAVKAA